MVISGELQQADFLDSLPAPRVAWIGAWLTAVAAALIALGELDGLVSQSSHDGQTWSLTGLTGPRAVFDWGETTAAWSELATLLGSGAAASTWIRWYAVVDVAFVLLYVGGSLALLAGLSVSTRASVWRRVVAGGALVVGAVADLLESALLWDLADALVRPTLLVGASALKWVALGVAAFAVVLIRRRAGDHRRGPAHPSPFVQGQERTPPGPVGTVLRALYTHRFSLLVLVPFAVLGLAKGSDILDQLPDVQRQWVDDGPGDHVVWGTALTVGVAGIIVVIGRLRSHHVAMRVWSSSAPYAAPAHSPWVVTAAIIAVGAVVSTALFRDSDLIWRRFLIALAVPAAIGGLSLLWRRFASDDPWGPYRRPVRRQQARTTTVVGDVLGVLIVVVPGLGLVRAFTAPVALGARGEEVALLLAGFGGAVGAWFVAGRAGPFLARRAHRDLLTILTPGRTLSPQLSSAVASSTARAIGWVLFTIGVVLFVAIGARPSWLVDHRGVIETILLSVVAVALPLGATVILLQKGGAPGLLSRPGTLALRTAPVTTLIVITAVVVGLQGTDERVHGLRHLDVSALPERDTLHERVGKVIAEENCAVPLPGTSGEPTDHTIRPVFLLAAEGGGIRAAAWTALGADALAAAGGDCASALLSSGASGGAVGLTVSAFSPPGEAFSAVTRLAGPQALGTAVAGLVIRDPVRSVTGIAFPTPGEDGWIDRAGLMELQWESEVGVLRKPFLPGLSTAVTGPLVLNSTSATTSCRTLLSQLELDAQPEALNCQTDTSVPNSVDLLPTLRAACPASGQQAESSTSVPRLRASTVALLASRFPYVTPSGVVTGDCDDGEMQSQQIVDGGYADNDGIGTVVDLAERWLPMIRSHNDAVVAAPGSAPLLLPVLVYLNNGQGSDLAAPPARATNEALVPVVTKGKSTAALSSADAQLHRAAAVFAVERLLPGCSGEPSSAAPTPEPGLCAAAAAWRGPVVKVFFQPTRPSVAAPLGWVLSQASLNSLTCDRNDQVSGAGVPPVPTTGPCGAPAFAPPEPVPTGDRCADRPARDDSPLAAKGYGTMVSALCLASEAAAEP